MIPTPQSSSVRAIGYEPRTRELHIRWDSGTYAYAAVPAVVWAELRAADSKGQYVNTRVKGVFAHRKVA
ncbi:KTSC domain-containing protein [Conexibacter sp. CPCC 205762]